MSGDLLAVRVPAGWAPDWPAFPIDGGDDLPALHGPVDCERCDGTTYLPMPPEAAGSFGISARCPDCSNGKVPQRVALVTERPCETTCHHGTACGYHKRHGGQCCTDCTDCVRLVATHTAQVDAVVPIVEEGWDETPAVVVCTQYEFDRRMPKLRRSRLVVFPPGSGDTGVDLDNLFDLADWSPGRWAVLTSDVQPWAWPTREMDVFVRPFTGPIARLSDVLA